MGANHFSHTVFDADPAEVRALMVAWMRAKGLALQAGEPRTALDAKHERGLRIAWKDGVVVVLGDTLMELQRQAFELRKLGRPLLDLWMHDSDIWGYALWSEGKVASAFHSDPTYFGPAEPAQGPDDVHALCRLAGRGDPTTIRSIQERKQRFAEGCSAAFAEALGAAAAANQYGYVTAMDLWPPEGWQSEHLWFRAYDWDPMAGFDVAGLSFTPAAGAHPWVDLSPEELAEQQAQAARAMKQAQRWGCLMQAVFWPFQLPMRLWMWWRTRRLTSEMTDRTSAARAMKAPAPIDWEAMATVEQRDGRLHSAAHALSVPIPEGARVGPQDRVVFGPGQVLGLTVGDTPMRLVAHPPSAARQLAQMAGHSGELTHEVRTLGPHRVAWARCELRAMPHAPDAPARTRLMALLAGPGAVYAIDTMPLREEADAVAAVMAEALAGLRFEDAETAT